MPKSVIFHIGLPKTGTTTLQNYLRNNEEHLRTLGVLYPGENEYPALKWFKHLMILSALLGKEPPKSDGLDARGGREVVDRVFGQFRESGLQTLLWSHEGISSKILSLDRAYLNGLVAGLNVRIFAYVRYLDEWIESLYKERIRAQGGRGLGRLGRRKPRVKPRPLMPIAPHPDGRAAQNRPTKSMLEEAAELSLSLRAIRDMAPAAEIVVRSYDANRQKGTVVSGALTAMGLPASSAFLDADDDAGIYNPTKSNLYSMLIYQLLLGHAEVDVVRAVTVATLRRDRAGVKFDPLGGRRFRFLSEIDIIEARAYYDALRQDYPDLPVQPDYAPDPAERSLPSDDGVALLHWLRPDISDAVFEQARAALQAA
jgi:hypothetical protein